VLVCLESYLSEGPLALVRAGADLLVATTSDVTFGSTATVFEHLAGTQLRAVEVGRAIVWASNAGPSGVIERWGDLSVGPFREPNAVRVTARTYVGTTPYVRFRAFWAGFALALLAAALFHGSRQKARPRDTTSIRFGSRIPPLARVVLGLLIGGTAIALSPALVELRHGRVERALSAIRGALRPSTTVVQADDPYAPFRAPSGRFADGALAYLLTYYGLDSDTESVRSGLPDASTAEASARFLEQHHGLRSRPLDLNLESTPALAWLGELHDGTLVVLDYAGEGDVRIFVPQWKRLATIPPERVAELVRPRGYVPVWSAE